MKGNADWLSDPSSVINKYTKTIHSSTKTIPIQTSKKSNEKTVFSNLKDDKQEQRPKFQLGQVVRTADIQKVFSKGDSTKWFFTLYTLTKVIQDTIPSHRINYLPERYDENLLLPTKLILEENNKIMEELNLIQ